MKSLSTAQSSLGFPQPLAEKYRPRKICGFYRTGQTRKVLSAFAKRPVSWRLAVHRRFRTWQEHYGTRARRRDASRIAQDTFTEVQPGKH